MGTSSGYPQPHTLPAIVDEDLLTVLSDLEVTLREHAPTVAESLQPGLSNQEIMELEETYGFQLTDELRALYKWHNGTSSETVIDFIPGHRFLSLDEAVRERVALRSELKESTVLQRAAYDAVASHMTPWLTLLSDGAGDGYFYDPTRQSAGCEIFYTITELGHFVFYPSLKNLLTQIRDCYDSGAYTVAVDGRRSDEDYDASFAIQRKYGTEIED